MPRPQPDDAPPERIGGLLGGKRTVEVGCRAQQAFHASAGIVEGGESFAENSDPWVASDRGRQQSYPVSRLLAHRRPPRRLPHRLLVITDDVDLLRTPSRFQDPMCHTPDAPPEGVRVGLTAQTACTPFGWV